MYLSVGCDAGAKLSTLLVVVMQKSAIYQVCCWNTEVKHLLLMVVMHGTILIYLVDIRDARCQAIYLVGGCTAEYKPST
jgi:hypothetical protein